jgi:hypothetical protein
MQSFRSLPKRLAALATAAVALCSACSTPPSPSAPAESSPAAASPNWPAIADQFRFHWYAAPGIDLTTEPAVALRAYLESYRLVDFTGQMSAAYPGFLQATPKNGPTSVSGYPIQLGMIRPGTRTDPPPGDNSKFTNVYGYSPYFVASLEPMDGGFRALVCEGDYSIFRRDRLDQAKYRSIVRRSGSADPPAGDLYGIKIGRIELTGKDPRAPFDRPASPTTPQRGPAPAPSNDVFGPWFVTAASFTLWGNLGEGQDIGTPELERQCAENMPDDAAARRALYTDLFDQPPPHGDPIPGWPAN